MSTIGLFGFTPRVPSNATGTRPSLPRPEAFSAESVRWWRCIPLAVFLLLVAGAASAASQERSSAPYTSAEYAEDFDVLWHFVRQTYVYLDPVASRWETVRARYGDQLQDVGSRGEFVSFLERVLAELRDHHAHLGTHTASSPNLVPSRTDLWGGSEDGWATILQVRPGSPADSAGVEAGMEVLAVDGVAVERATCRRLGRREQEDCREASTRDRQWALNGLLAGRRTGDRRFRLRGDEGIRDFVLPPYRPPEPTALVESMTLDGDVGYVRIHDSLGRLALVPAFDAALHSLRDTEALILDLRDTPSGGNATVARGIMGRLIEEEQPYQVHRVPEPEPAGSLDIPRSWVERVSPRGSYAYRRPVVVLVDHWTGSMGEGLAIGLDGMDRATVVGTPMAGLRGATHSRTLPNTGITVSVPGERLDHVDGTPREDWIPPVTVDLSRPHPAEDPILSAGLEVVAAQAGNATP